MRLIKRLSTLCAVTLFAAAGLAAGPAHADYPDRPIRLLIPFGAGGITDVAGRVIGQYLGEALATQVIIENRPGAGGTLAAQAVSTAKPDGYTLLLGTVGTQVVNKMLYQKLAYDPAALTPVSLVSNSPYVLAINNVEGVDDLAGLTAYARAHPGKLNFGSAGNGSSPHLAIELFKLATQTDIVHIPFKSGSEAVNAAIGGQVNIVIDALPVIEPHARANRLKILAIADDRRNAVLPDLKTSAEQGLPQFEIGSWNALVAPAGTPDAQVAVLNEALKKALARPALIERLAHMGIEPMPTGVEAYRAHVAKETTKWSEVIQAAGTRLD